jgi:hypothetical protein
VCDLSTTSWTGCFPCWCRVCSTGCLNSVGQPLDLALNTRNYSALPYGLYAKDFYLDRCGGGSHSSPPGRCFTLPDSAPTVSVAFLP